MANAKVKTLMNKAADMCNEKYELAKMWGEIDCTDNERLEMLEWSKMNDFCAELFDMEINEWINYTCYKNNPEF